MLFNRYGIFLQAIALIHFVRRRPDTFWLFVILMGGSIGALVYLIVEVVPDAGLLRGSRSPRSVIQDVGALEKYGVSAGTLAVVTQPHA